MGFLDPHPSRPPLTVVSSPPSPCLALQTHLAEAFQDLLHLLVSPEEVSQRLFHRVQVSQGLLLLEDQLLHSLVGDRFLSLFILWQERQKSDSAN